MRFGLTMRRRIVAQMQKIGAKIFSLRKTRKRVLYVYEGVGQNSRTTPG
jgi:hypothetical protein